jgi:HEAT repeat protein
VRRPVAPYVVPVDGVTIPAGAPADVAVIAVAEPVAQLAGTRAVDPAAATDAPLSPRLLELVALQEGQPDLAALAPYLADADARVRRAAVATVTEVVPDGAGPALAAALLDGDETVRAAAAAALRELVEVLSPDQALHDALVAAGASTDPVSRAVVLDTLRALRLGDASVFVAGRDDDDARVRLQAVRGLVALDDVAGVAGAADDPQREVRVAVAHGLGTIGALEGEETLARLVADDDHLVRAAALEAGAGLPAAAGWWERARTGLTAPEWQVRVGSVRGLASAPPTEVAGAVAAMVDDPFADVRKAAVIALGAWTDRAEVVDALERATKDVDADVRGYARRALA